MKHTEIQDFIVYHNGPGIKGSELAHNLRKYETKQSLKINPSLPKMFFYPHLDQRGGGD